MIERFHEANNADIVAVAAELGLKVFTNTNPPTALCPFHGDTGKPNLTFFSTGTKYSGPHYNCFACDAHGSVIDLVMRVNGCDKFEAVEFVLRRKFERVAYTRQEKPAPTKDLTYLIRECHDRIYGVQGQRWMEELESRGITQEAVQVAKLGVWREDSSTYSGRLVIPYLRPPGQSIISLKARALPEVIKAAEESGSTARYPKYLAPAGSGSLVFWGELALEFAAAGYPIIMCEGELDAISVWIALRAIGMEGAYGICAIPGVQNFKSEADYESARVYVLFDNDDAGHRAADGYTTIRGGPRQVAERDERPAQTHTSVSVHGQTTLYHPGIIERLSAVNAYPIRVTPSLTDMNETLQAYGPEGTGQWLIEEIAALERKEEEVWA